MKTTDLIEEVATLPIEDRALIADSILRSLNSTSAEVDRQWVAVAKQRLADIQSGKVHTIPASEVFERIQKRLNA